jgi:hypothetical protein
MAELLPDDLVSSPMDAPGAREKCIEAAEMIVAKHVPGGFWRWIDNKRLRVYKSGGGPFLTLYIEELQ